MTTIREAQQFVDHAAQSDDRWLFIATLIILLGFGALVIKWLINRLEQQTAAYSQVMEKFGVVIHDCGRVLEDVKNLLNKMK